jgi:amino-acid N-acetyltransferase
MPTNVHSQFVAWFRSAAPYFNAFRGKSFVIDFGSEVVANYKFGHGSRRQEPPCSV